MKGYNFESQYVLVDRLNVHCRVAGPEDGLPLLFIHGLSGFSRDWDLLDLPEGLRLLAMDLPGFGDSDQTPDHRYPLQLMIKSMVEVLSAFARKPALIVAHSRGARQVLALPAERNDLIRAMVLIDGAPSVPPEARMQTAKNIAGTPHRFSSLAEAAEVFRLRFRAYTQEQLEERLRHYLRRLENGTYEIKRDPIYQEEFQKVLDGTEPPESGPNWWELFSNVTKPIYFVVAKRSKMVNEEILDRMKSFKPDLKVFTIDSGHNIPAEKPEVLSDVLRQVINDLK
jgi:lipase